ncbi:hypothetical protein ABR737_43680 [Streptomyces sp. Edi2]|uniref:hypothetical protein n=1 Tax=Streptomyces sp. Edi2 TaxID=3162528 RepID=UPI003305BA1C
MPSTDGRCFPAPRFRRTTSLCLIDVNMVGFWNSGTALRLFLELGLGRFGSHRRLRSDAE